MFLIPFLIPSVHAWLWSRQAASPVIDLGYSQYRGTYDSSLDISSFLGLRYAAPPTGNLRWQAPQPPPTTTTLQPADIFQAQCYQAGLGGASTNPFLKATNVTKRDALQNEDCLFLNVFTPSQPSSSNSLPVVVWIHGGGYTSGNAVIPSVRDMVVLSNNKIIAVQMQYRLGAFGFLSSAKVKANGAVNAGLLDQQYALEWVQKYIAKFGGDPSKVTIWGESAGAGSVLAHIIANGGNTNPPLFRAAMTSSIYLPAHYQYNDAVPELVFSGFAATANCGLAADQMSCLRSQSDSTLENANQFVTNSAFLLTSPWAPVIDGSFITDRPSVLFSNGNLNGQAVYSVSNVFEGTSFVPPVAELTLLSYLPQLIPTLSASDIQQAISLYQIMQPSDYHRAIGLLTEQVFVCPAYWLLEAFGNKGKKAYKGEFWKYPGVHAQDVSYYMPGILTTADITAKIKASPFTIAFAQSFLSVVISMDPAAKFDSTNIMPTPFNTWSPSSTFEMQFSNTTDGTAAVGPATSNAGILQRCNFWKSVSASTHQ